MRRWCKGGGRGGEECDDNEDREESDRGDCGGGCRGGDGGGGGIKEVRIVEEEIVEVGTAKIEKKVIGRCWRRRWRR